MSLRFYSQLNALLPRLARSFVNRAVSRPIPSATRTGHQLEETNHSTYDRRAEPIATPEAFLSSIGRASETKVKVESWDELWRLDSSALRKQGLTVKDRRSVHLDLYFCRQPYIF